MIKIIFFLTFLDYVTCKGVFVNYVHLFSSKQFTSVWSHTVQICVETNEYLGENSTERRKRRQV